jgi:hypothetical protein
MPGRTNQPSDVPDPDRGGDEAMPIIPAAGSHRPGAVNVRLVALPEVMAAALASLTDFYGDAWQPSRREPARSSDGHLLLTGTLIVAVPTATSQRP